MFCRFATSRSRALYRVFCFLNLLSSDDFTSQKHYIVIFFLDFYVFFGGFLVLRQFALMERIAKDSEWSCGQSASCLDVLGAAAAAAMDRRTAVLRGQSVVPGCVGCCCCNRSQNSSSIACLMRDSDSEIIKTSHGFIPYHDNCLNY